MKNVTKILTAAVLCAALFASDQRINALGGNAGFWPGDEANIANFPAQMNNHSYVQLAGVGGDTNSASILWNDGGTTWGFDFDNSNEDWFNINWGSNGMGVAVGMINWSDGGEGTAENAKSGHNLGWGKGFDWGEIGVGLASSTTTTGEVQNAATCVDGTGADVTDDTTVDDATCVTAGGAGSVFTDASTDAAFDTDWAKTSLNFSRSMDLWAFDTILASYSSTEVGDADAVTNLSVDFASHMNAGAADVVFAMGLDMDDDGTDDGASNTMKSTVAVEANMTDWATARAGATYEYNLSSDDDKTGNAFGWAWGLGFNWGDFTADFTVNDDIFSTPIKTITGYGDGITKDSDDVSATFTYSF